MRPDRLLAAAAFGALVTLAACSGAAGTNDGSSSTSSTSTGVPSISSPTTPDDGSAAPASDAGSAVPASPPPAGSGALLVAGAGPDVHVRGGDFPPEIVQAYGNRAGELLDVGVWDARFDTYGLPRLVAESGRGVALVEATLDTRRDGDAWQRTDELQWLFADGSLAGIDPVLADAAAALGIGGWSVERTTDSVDGANCVHLAYSDPAGSSTVWRIQGCAYPKLPGLWSFGVGRDGRFTGTDVPSVNPTVGTVTAAVGGQVDAVLVTFGHPEAEGSVTTLRSRVEVGWSGDLTTAIGTLSAGPLAGWDQFPGDGSTMFASEADADSWTVGPEVLQFTSEGRLQR